MDSHVILLIFKRYSTSFCKFDHDRAIYTLKEVRVGELSAPFFIDVLAVKVLRQHSNEKLEIGLGKCLAQADSSSTIERHPSLWVPFLAVGSQAELVRVVESIGEKFGWLLPLLAVVMDTGDVVHNGVTFL